MSQQNMTAKEAIAALNDGVAGIIEALGILDKRIRGIEDWIRWRELRESSKP